MATSFYIEGHLMQLAVILSETPLSVSVTSLTAHFITETS